VLHRRLDPLCEAIDILALFQSSVAADGRGRACSGENFISVDQNPSGTVFAEVAVFVVIVTLTVVLQKPNLNEQKQ
jgi:hypothetical protein